MNDNNDNEDVEKNNAYNSATMGNDNNDDNDDDDNDDTDSADDDDDNNNNVSEDDDDDNDDDDDRADNSNNFMREMDGYVLTDQANAEGVNAAREKRRQEKYDRRRAHCEHKKTRKSTKQSDWNYGRCRSMFLEELHSS